MIVVTVHGLCDGVHVIVVFVWLSYLQYLVCNIFSVSSIFTTHGLDLFIDL